MNIVIVNFMFLKLIENVCLSLLSEIYILSFLLPKSSHSCYQKVVIPITKKIVIPVTKK